MMKGLCVDEEDREEVACIQYNLGHQLDRTREIHGTEMGLRECLESRRRMPGTHGANDFKLAVTIRQVGGILLRKKGVDDAEKLMRECLSLVEGMYAQDDLLVAHFLRELAIV